MNKYNYRLNVYKIFVIFLISNFYGCTVIQNIECTYVPKKTETNKYPELTQYTDCAQINDQQEIIINDNHLNKIWFDGSGLAEIRVFDGVYYLNKNGKVIKSYLYDNGADYFQEGLSRTEQNNKLGFIDAQLKIVIKPEYDFAYPFSGGVSKVCLGCKKVKIGEHTEMQNGQWGYIDKSGNVVIDILHEYDDLNNVLKNKEK